MSASALPKENNLSITEDNSDDYNEFCTYLEKTCGITLGANKSYLVNSRLKPIKESYDFNTLSDVIKAIEFGKDISLKGKVIDAMTTNETSWFRDKYPYEVLKSNILVDLKSTSHVPKIWSAACSFGHEPYSISIAFEEYIEKNPGQYPQGIEIIGTDISRRALAQSRAGEYDELGLARGLSSERKQKYFAETQHGMQLIDKIKQRVRFQEFNLLNSYATLGQFDVIFCRNVLIYFSIQNKTTILNKMAEIMRPNGFLFLGASEPIVNYCTNFEMESINDVVYYRRK